MLHLKNLSDLDLRRHLASLAHDLRATEAELLLHLHELRERQLFAAAGYSSCFTYCVKELGFSEGRACRWLGAARVIARFPVALALLQEGKVHATALAMLEKHLTEQNYVAVLERAVGRTKRELEDLVAELAPKADVPDSIRKQAKSGEEAAADRQKGETAEQLGLHFATPGSEEAAGAASGEPAKNDTRTTSKAAGRVAPLSPQRVLVKFSASRELEAKLRRAQALLSRKVPQGELAAVFELALDALLEGIDPERKAERKAQAAAARAAQKANQPSRQDPAQAEQSQARPEQEPAAELQVENPPNREAVPPREPASPAEPALSAPSVTPTVAPTVTPTPTPTEATTRSRYIPAAVRLAAWQEAGGQCTYKSPEGKRCEERRWLELDHCEPWAMGGLNNLANLRLYCRTHNAYAARQSFGPWRGASKTASTAAAEPL